MIDKPQNGIFITARFRSGSTLLWNIFRNLNGTHAYYEPLHEQLPELISLNIPPQRKHYFVDSYFKEYPNIASLKQFHKPEFGVSRLFLEKDDKYPDLQNYINYLMAYPSKSDIPVFQFNRIDFRLPWIKRSFTDTLLIHLYRSARDQWVSTIEDYPKDIDKDVDSDPYRIATWSRDLVRQFPFLSAPFIRHPYQRYYYLWKLSYLMGRNLSNLSIAYEDILSNPEKSLRGLLELGQLDTQKNVKQCLSIIVKRPVNIWHKYRDEEWFHEMEQECESYLTSLGLNRDFGIKPLEKIISKNPQYKNLTIDTQPISWATRSGQVTIIQLLNVANEKEKVIQGQKKTLNEQVSTIKKLYKSLEKREQDIAKLNSKINHLQNNLDEKEHVINNIRSSLFFWLQNGPLRHNPFLTTLARYLRVFRHFFLSKLGVLVQHPPKPLEIPTRYSQAPIPKPDAPVISIVTPSYNQAEFIGKTIQSVLGQKYPKLEYVIQDGKSSDSTFEILKNHADRLSHFESRRDRGQAHAINLGFQHTHGEIMAYLNSDDILLPGSLNYVANYFQKHPEVDAIYSHRVIINADGLEVGRWLLPPHDKRVLYWADYVPQETLFWRRSIWEKAGGKMDESFQFALDWDLLLRFQEMGAIIHRTPRFLAAFRIHETQKTSAHINLIGAQEMKRLRIQYLGHEVTNDEIMKQIQPYLRLSILYHKLFRLRLIKP